MKMPNVLPVALLIAAGLFSTPGAVADTRSQAVEIAFSYNPADTAQNIYSDLERKVRKACAPSSGVRQVSIRRYDRVCVKEMLDQGVSKIGRPDIAALHNGSSTILVTESRG